MKRTITILKITFLLFVLGLTQSANCQTFVHPGLPFTAYDLAQLKANITKEPWLTGYTALKSDAKSQLDYGMRGPFATVTRAPNLNNTAWISDMQAIHNLTFMWVFTGDTAYAGKATRMLDAWAVTNTTWGGGENMLDIGDQVSYLVPAADILKSMFSGWTAANTTHINNYFANVLYPTSAVPRPLRDNNKGALQLKIAISIAAFLDDVTKFNQAIECYRMDAGGGLRCSLPNGEVGDAGRDDHWSVQIEALGWSAEVAWKQGVDLFAELGNRLFAIGELYNHYSLHPTDLTFVPFGGYAAYWTNWGINPGYNHNGNPLNNIIHAAYSIRKGISTPYTDEMLATSNPSGLSFLYLKTSDPSKATALTPMIYPGDLAQPVSYFSNLDIGNTGLAGTASYNSGTWTAQGAGNSPANAVNYTFKPVKGDVGMIIRIEGNSIYSATSGLMIRESLLSTSKYVSVNLSSSGVSVSAQGHSDQSSYTHWQPSVPWWLKIERVGNRVFTYHSRDGVNWTNNALFIITLPTDAYIGFYTISNNTSALNTATFTHVALNNTFPVGSPEINSVTSATATVGAAFNFAVTASGSPTTYSATGLPSGLSLDAAAGVISGTPTTPGQSIVTVSATNASGTGTATLVINVINNVAPTPPSSLTASVVKSNNISLAWTSSDNASSYTVKRSLTSGGPYTTIQSGIISTTFIDFSPVYEVNNYYVVIALSGTLESVVSNEVFASVPPAIPSSLKATSKSGEIDLSWDVAAGAATYRLSRGTTSGGPYTSLITVSTNSYSDIAVTDGNPYYYVVSSLGSTKESANSSEVFGVPGSSSSTWSSTPNDTAWNVAANWVEGSVPTTPAIMTFNTSSDTTLVNNITGLEASRIQFNAGADAYKISGNSLVIRNDLVNNSAMPDTLTMPVTLTSQLNVFANTGRIALTGNVSGTGGILKTGNYELVMTGANTYSGNSVIRGLNRHAWGSKDGILVMGTGTGTSGSPSSGPLGTGKIVFEGGSLFTSTSSTNAAVLYNDIFVDAGKAGYLYEEMGEIHLYGKLTGSGTIWNDGSGNYSALHLKGDNSGFTGTFVAAMRSGMHRIKFDVPESGSANATWNLDANGADCQGITFTSGTLNFGALTGRGLIRNDAASGTVTISIGALSTDTWFNGTISCANTNCNINLEKVGTGTFLVGGNQNYGGTTTVKNGTFLLSNNAISGVFISPITASGGAFGGTGICSSTVTIGTGSGTGARFVPGTDGTIGKFTSTALVTLNSDATYKVDVNSTNSTSDSIVCNGITINNAVLSVADLGSGVPALSTKYMIVKNTSASAVTGTFKNLSEFSLITIGGYDFRISYLGGDGNDIVLIDDRTVTKAVPVAPANVVATATSSSSVGINWSKSPVSDYVTSYTVKRSTTDGGAYTVLASNLKDTTYQDKNLTYNTIYYYVVSAINYLGESANSAQDSAETPMPPIPGVPGGLILAAGDAKASLSWNVATEATSYNIKRASVSGGPYTNLSSGVTATTYTDNTVVNGTAYYYVISSVNITGESANSAEVSVTPATGGYSYWPCNENSGTTATDVWGARNATLNGAGATWVSGVSGTGIRCDGTSSGYASLPSGVVSTLSGDFTLSAWVKFDVLQNNQRILDFGTSTNNYMFISQNAATTIRYGIKVGSGSEQGITSTALSLVAGKWLHVALTLSGSTHALYINGMPVGASTGITFRPSGLGSTTLNYFGKSQFSDPLLKGTLDDIRIYSRALSPSEVTSIVNGPAPDAITTLNGSAIANQPVLTWTASSEATSYTIRRATVAAGPYTIIASSVTATTYTDATTSLYGTYHYMVTPVAGAFEGAPSNIATITILPSIPTSVIATGWNGRVDLSWAASGATSYDIKRATNSGGPYTTVANVTATTYSNTGLANGTPYYYVITAVNAAGSSAFSSEVNATPIANNVADVWSHNDVGAVGISGNAGYSDGVLTVYSSGADIWTKADAFQYVYQPFNITDGAIVARLVTQDNTATPAKAGVMIRESLSLVDSRVALVDRTPGSAVEYIRRTATNTNAVATSVTGMTLPRWVKLVRSGTTTFTAYQSADGITWSIVGAAQTIAMGTNAYIGLAVCANNNTVINKSTFDHVNIATAIPVISGPTTATGQVSVAFTTTIVATNTPYLYTATGLPAGLTFNADNGVIYGIPTVAGSYTVTLGAVNAMGAATSKTLSLTIGLGDQSITFNAIADKKVNDVDFDPGATASSGLAATYSSSDVTVATIVNGKVHIVGAGTCTIYADQAGNTNYNAAPRVSQILVVNKLDQSITFNTLLAKTFGDADIDPEATASSDLAVTYSSSDITVATIVNGKVHIVGAGTCTIYADQAGNANYNDAPRVSRVLVVNKLEQTITFNPLLSKTFGDADIDPAATASSGLAVTYSSSDVTVATIVDGKVHIAGAGSCTIYADQAGDATYAAAPQTSQILIINRHDQSITFNAIPVKKVTDNDFDLGAITTSGLMITYSTSDANVATIVNGKVHIVAAGFCTIYADQAGDMNFTAASQSSQLLEVDKLDQSITFNPMPVKKVSDADFDPGAIANSGLAITYTSSNTAVATIVNGKIDLVSSGTCIIYADQPGNAIYMAAPQISQSLTVTPGTGVTDIGSPGIEVFPNPFSENLTVTFNSASYGVTDVELELISDKGLKIVSEKVSGTKYILQGRNIPAGVYFLKIRYNNITSVKKIIKY